MRIYGREYHINTLKSLESGYLKVDICFYIVTSHDHMLKGLKPLMVTHHLAMLMAIGRVQVEIQNI